MTDTNQGMKDDLARLVQEAQHRLATYLYLGEQMDVAQNHTGSGDNVGRVVEPNINYPLFKRYADDAEERIEGAAFGHALARAADDLSEQASEYAYGYENGHNCKLGNAEERAALINDIRDMFNRLEALNLFWSMYGKRR